MKDTKQVVLLNLTDILPNRFQPRIKFDEKAIIELSDSIKEHGVIQPIIVRKISDKYEIIAGERRYKASIMAGKEKIPAIIVELNDKDSSEIALIENVQRQDLTPIEEAISYRKILDMGYLTQEALANKLGVAQPTIANKLRLLNLDDEVQEALLDGKISERHARSLLRLEKNADQRAILNRIIEERLTVRKTDEVINNMLNNKNASVLDSLEKGMPVQDTNNTIQDNTSNPFIIDTPQQVVSPQMNPNVEVLDFGFEDISVPESTQNIQPNMNTNIPMEPIIEDDLETPTNIPIMPVEQPQNTIEQIPQTMIEQPSPSTNINMQPTNVIPTENNIQNQNMMDTQTEKPLDSNPQVTPQTNRFFTMVSPVDDEPTQSNVTINEAQNPQMEFNQPQQIINESVNQNTVYGNMPQNDVNTVPELNNIFNSVPPVNTDIEPITNDVNNYNYQNMISPTPQEIEVEPIPQQTITSLENYNIEEPQNNIQTISQPQFATSEELVGSTLRDVINKMRRCADEIENMGFEIDTEEFDFDDIYQVIFKIKK